MKKASFIVLIAMLLVAVGGARPAYAAARSTDVVFVNHTANTLIKVREGLDHGEWIDHPPDTVYPGTEVHWRSESNGVLTGTEGWVRYYLQRTTPPPNIPDSDTFYMHWDNPFVGANSYDENVPAGREQEFGFKREGGGGSDADVKWTLTGLVGGLADSDGDSIPDDWESNGVAIQPNGTGAPVFVNLPAMGADPNKPDIFVQTDWMQDATHNQQLQAAAIQKITQAFANAPYTSPTSSTGINLHVDNGSSSIMNPATNTTWGNLSHAQSIPWATTLGTTDSSGNYDWTAFQAIKDLNFTPTGRGPIFHYVIVANTFNSAGNSGVSRNASMIGTGASDLLVTLGTFSGGTGTINQQAGTFMHELGHNLGLEHGGGDGVNYKPNYLSVMNYSFQTAGLIVSSRAGTFDYSRSQPGDLNEPGLNETIGVNGAPAGYGTIYYCGTTAVSLNNATGQINWNCNTNPAEPNIGSDINQDGQRTKLISFNDWANLKFNGGAIGQAGAVGLPMVTPADETYTPQISQVIEAAVAPITTLAYSGGAPGQNGWLVTPVVVSLSASDPLANAIAFSEYSFDNQQWTRYSTPFALPEGVTTVFYRSQNSVGVLEDAKQQTFKVDTIAPTSALGIGQPQYASGPPSVIPSITPLTLSATDTNSGVQHVSYRFFRQGSTPPAYTITPGASTQFTLTGPDGLYEVDSFATDVAGNAEPPHVLSIRLSNTRVVNGLQTLYTFEEGGGTIVHDVAGGSAPLDLTIGDPTTTRWTSGGLVISATTILASTGPAAQLTNAISRTSEFTVEAWVKSAHTPQPVAGSIVTLATDPLSRNLTLAQAPNGTRGHYEASLRTTTTSAAGRTLRTASGTFSTDLVHLSYTRDALGTTRLYLNGAEQEKRTVTGQLSNWDTSFRLALGNELGGGRPWLGEYQLVALYSRALSPAEVSQNLAAGSNGDAGRLATGLQTLYTFKEGGGTIVHDLAGSSAPLDLTIGNPTATYWISDGLVISATTVLASSGPAAQLTNAISRTGELSLEAWVTPAEAHQQTLARIAAVAEDDVHRNVELVQERREDQDVARYTVRLRTSTTPSNGTPPLQSPEGSALPMLQHIVYTRDAYGQTRLYINGVQQAQSLADGNLSAWNSAYHLTLANTIRGDRPWLGVYHLVALYTRALGPTEVRQNFRAGLTGDQLPTAAPKLQALYSFDEGSGAIIHDVAVSDTPLDLQLADASKVHWTIGGMAIDAPTLITSADAASHLTEAAHSSNEITIEAWIKPTVAQRATILSLAAEGSHHNIALSQDGHSASSARYSGRLWTSTTIPDGDLLRTPTNNVPLVLTHVVYTCDALGVARLYVNDVLQAEHAVAGNFSIWDQQAHLVLANDLDGAPSWLGEYQLLAIYSRALSPAEIDTHYRQGASTTAGIQ